MTIFASFENYKGLFKGFLDCRNLIEFGDVLRRRCEYVNIFISLRKGVNSKMSSAMFSVRSFFILLSPVQVNKHN